MGSTEIRISVGGTLSVSDNANHMEQNPITVLSLQVLSVVDRMRQVISSTSPIPIPSVINPLRFKSREVTKHVSESSSLDDAEAYSASPTLANMESDAQLPVYTLQEVSYHDTPDDCWTVIYDRVYDITNFIYEHPGGEDVMLEYAGRDATIAFRGVGHSKMAEAALEPYLIGILGEKDRIWRRLLGLTGLQI